MASVALAVQLGAAESDPLPRQQLVILLFGVEQGAYVPDQLPASGFGRFTALRGEPADSLPELIGKLQFPAQERHKLVGSDPLL